MAMMKFMQLFPLLFFLLVHHGTSFPIREATIDEIHEAFLRYNLSSRALVEFYLDEIKALNPILAAVIEVNPDALALADQADKKRRENGGISSGLRGIPILLKDNIATKDKMNTTAGSFALLDSVVPRDAGVVARLRKAGAIILGKASLSEWAYFRSLKAPVAWCARGGQGRNPYLLSVDPCGSSSGSAVGVAANLAMVSLGTETDGSILCPSSSNSVVGIKPTVGLTSRSGVIPGSPRQDSVGPICRTVSDAVHVLDAIVGFDPRDAEATGNASNFIPKGGYTQFLKTDGLKGKRLGILRNFFPSDPLLERTFENHFRTLRQQGAILVDNLQIANKSTILDLVASGEGPAVLAELKLSLNSYLSELLRSPVRSLADVILFNNRHSDQEKTQEYGQDIFLAAQRTKGIGAAERHAQDNMVRLSKQGIEKLMAERNLDAVVAPAFVTAESRIYTVLAIGGYPGISVPAGYRVNGVPFGICFGGLRGSEPKLIEIAFGFEQASRIRKPPPSIKVFVSETESLL
ncbi:hypothetical protein H6P81_018445 [Aristolochia fimbriata]|uniref:Amidase domain-containing protein n=1 Tax=Aristolochia fimbriata TaxID=158543 RepID=A0AAV7E4A9_ARIFI|nr:hypothetical protein H6P81_018445 [Aristolochia fimbriata]